MQKLKLVELIEALTPSEMRKFGDFIRSPFFNKNKKFISLYEFFEVSIADPLFKDITKENIWEHLYPGTEYNDTSIRSYISDFKKLLEKFLIVTIEELNHARQKIVLLNSYSERNLQKNFEAASNEISENFKNEFNRNYDYFNRKIDYERKLIHNSGKNIEVNQDSNYKDLSDTIDYYFLSSKLDLINSFISRKYHAFGNISLNIKFTKEIISYIEENLTEIKKNSPVIYSEYLILMMMTSEKTDRFFHDLYLFVRKNISRYNHSELGQVYYPIINYCFNKIALGESQYIPTIFDVYKMFERKGFYSEMKIFQDIDFISIIMVGLRLKKVPWVENFFENYSSKLQQDYKEDTVCLVKALINFQKKNYEASINFLYKVNYQNSFYYLKSKETLMMILYEQEEFEALQSLIDSTKHYLKRRQNVLSIHYERYMMFLKFVSMLLKTKQKDKHLKIILKKELGKNKNVIGREWLIEKTSEL